ncbi:MAG: Sua5/YciO/YrdC/YwlC family protein, partial [Planctomycetota bacterium]|nr:Sua5/YciO/YrdC/YwlC family protein [Planctomycetota bacterium]
MSNLRIDLFNSEELQRAADLLNAGEVVALPTDTVPGIFTMLGYESAAASLSDIKQSRADKPYSWHLSGLKQLSAITPQLPAGLHPWMLRRLQSKSTVLLPSSFVALSRGIDWSFDKIGFRLPQQVDFQNVAELCPKPLIGTSINNSGQPPLFGEEAIEWLEAKQVKYAVQLLDCKPQTQPSSIIDVFPRPTTLRGEEDDINHIGLSILVICTGNTCRSPLAAELLRSEIASSWGVKPPELEDFGWQIESAGIAASPGQSASANSQIAAAETSIDLSQHKSQSIHDTFDQQWDLVLCLSREHLSAFPSQSNCALFNPDNS